MQMLNHQLRYVDKAEMDVSISVTTVPPHTRLSRRWNPGEEFAYVYEGFFILHQENGPDEFYKKGDVGSIPANQTHTVSTQEEGATILIFSIQGEAEGTGPLDQK